MVCDSRVERQAAKSDLRQFAGMRADEAIKAAVMQGEEAGDGQT